MSVAFTPISLPFLYNVKRTARPKVTLEDKRKKLNIQDDQNVSLDIMNAHRNTKILEKKCGTLNVKDIEVQWVWSMTQSGGWKR